MRHTERIILPENEKYHENLSDSIHVAIEPIKLLFHSMSETEKHGDISIMGEAMFERATSQIEEMFKLVEEHVGVIKMTGACYHNSKSIEGGKLLSAKIC